MALLRRKFLHLGEKINVIQLNERGTNCQNIARLVGVSHGQVQRVLKNKEDIKRQWRQSSGTSHKLIRSRACVYPELNERLNCWLLRARRQNVPVSGRIIQVKARELAKQLGCKRFTASNGWLLKFQRRYDMTSEALDRLAAEIGRETVNQWLQTFGYSNTNDQSQEDFGDENDLTGSPHASTSAESWQESMKEIEENHGGEFMPAEKIEAEPLSASKNAETEEREFVRVDKGPKSTRAELKALQAVVLQVRGVLRQSNRTFTRQVWTSISDRMHSFGWPQRSWFDVAAKGKKILQNLLAGKQTPNPPLQLPESDFLRPNELSLQLPFTSSLARKTVPVCGNNGMTASYVVKYVPTAEAAKLLHGRARPSVLDSCPQVTASAASQRTKCLQNISVPQCPSVNLTKSYPACASPINVVAESGGKDEKKGNVKGAFKPPRKTLLYKKVVDIDFPAVKATRFQDKVVISSDDDEPLSARYTSVPSSGVLSGSFERRIAACPP